MVVAAAVEEIRHSLLIPSVHMMENFWDSAITAGIPGGDFENESSKL